MVQTNARKARQMAAAAAAAGNAPVYETKQAKQAEPSVPSVTETKQAKKAEPSAPAVTEVDHKVKKRKRAEQQTGCEDGSGKVMLVTGGSSGLGSHLVAHFAAAGWIVVALARHKAPLAAACTHENAHAFRCDISDKEKVVSTVGKILEQFGKIDVLVNNAAVSHDGKKFWELELDDVDKLIDVNLKGTMYVTHAVLSRAMIPRDQGFIFGIASVAGTWGIPNESCYVASKHGMVGFLDTVANETRSTGVCVSTICPGGIDTPWYSLVASRPSIW